MDFVDFTFGMNNINIVSVCVKHLDVSNNSCEVKTSTSVEVGNDCMKMDRCEGWSGSAVPCSTIVGGTTGSITIGIVFVSCTGSLSTIEIDIEDSLGQPSSVVPSNAVLGGGTGYGTSGNVLVRGTWTFDIGYWKPLKP